MKMERILLAVDGSEYSDRAIEYTIGLAHLTKAEIVLLHCRKVISSLIGEPNFQRALDQLEADAEKTLHNYKMMLEHTDIPFTALVLGGDPAHTIAETAKTEKCDVVVLGSKGKSNFEGIMVGSVTHKVLQLSEIPVLVVK